MGSATNCCTHLVPAEAIKGKDEILSKYSEKDNKIDNNIIIKEIDSKSNSNNSNNNEIQVNSNQLPSNNIELETLIEISYFEDFFLATIEIKDSSHSDILIS